MKFTDFKILIEHYVGLERDALHIHAAILLYLVAMFAFRATRRSRIPWLFVLGVELANEANDLWQQAAIGEPPRWSESLKDVWNTMLWPTVLLFIGRYTSLFHHRSHDSRSDEPAPDGAGMEGASQGPGGDARAAAELR